MNSEIWSSIDTSLKAIVLIGIAVFVRALGRSATSKQLTFFKVYGQTIGLVFSGWFVQMIRSKLLGRDRLLLVFILSGYTTALSLFLAPWVGGRALSIMFSLFFVGASSLRLFLQEEYGGSLRQFLLTPLFVSLMVVMMLGAAIASGQKETVEGHMHAYLALHSSALAAAFLVGVALSFFFVVSTDEGRGAWQSLIADVASVSFVAPVLIFFFGEGDEIIWISILSWGIKVAITLICFDVVKKFVPRFALKQPETLLLKFAFPLVAMMFLVLYLSGAKT